MSFNWLRNIFANFFMDDLVVRLMPSLHHPTRRGGRVLYRSAYAILVTQLESESACVCGLRTCHRGGRPFRPMCLQILWACPDFELSVGDTVWSSKIQVNSHRRHRPRETSSKALTLAAGWTKNYIQAVLVHASHPHWTSTTVPVRLCIHSFLAEWQIPAEVDWLSWLRSAKNKN